LLFNNFNPIVLLYIIPAILLSLSFHEFSHAFVSYMFGDPTAKNQGRLTLNPKRHLDPLGTLMIIISTISSTGIGWAKPVPINPMYYKNRKMGTLLVSLAGPGSNVFLAFIASFPLLFIAFKYGDQSVSTLSMNAIIYNLSLFFFRINLSLAVFNLLPVPPLDGSKVLSAILPSRQYFQLMQYENIIGIIFLVIIFIFPTQLGRVMYPFIKGLSDLIINIVNPVINMLL
jgi:Zn-dependent protease